MYAIAGSAGYNIVSSFRSTEDALPIIAAGSAMGGYSGFKSGSVSGGISGAIGGMIVTTMATVRLILITFKIVI